jgi:NADH-quinone oxidoreductase subunit H
MAEFLATDFMPEWLAYFLVATVQCLLLFTLALVAAAAFTWAERKVSGRLQDRLGPTRVGGRFGWLQSPADGLKLICKEDFVPGGADVFLFKLAPYISFGIAFSVFIALPFADNWVAVRLDTAAFFVLAIAGLEVFGAIIGGYGSASKWSLYGAMREMAQVVSYEVPLGFCVVIPVMIVGSMDLVEIGNFQNGWFTSWLLFHDPFTFVTGFIFLTCATAGCNRAPFDLAEAESELVAGFLTEYSGFRWSTFFMAEYTAMTAICILGSILFLGGWNGPIPIATYLGLTPEVHPVAGYFGNLLGMTNLITKAVLGVLFMMWLRWTLPRIRIDQVITLCWKYCTPIVAAMLVGAMLWTFGVRGGWSETITEKQPADNSQTSAALTNPNNPLAVIERCISIDYADINKKPLLEGGE